MKSSREEPRGSFPLTPPCMLIAYGGFLVCSSSWPPEAPAVRRIFCKKTWHDWRASYPPAQDGQPRKLREENSPSFWARDKILDGKYAETHDLKGPGTRQVLLPLLSFEPDGVHRLAAARPAENLAQHGAAVKWIFFFTTEFTKFLLLFLPGSRQGRLKERARISRGKLALPPRDILMRKMP